jgi:uncharacterized protein
MLTRSCVSLLPASSADDSAQVGTAPPVTTRRRGAVSPIAAFLLLIAIVLAAASPAAAATPYPAPSGYVVDAAGVLPGPVQQQLAGELASFEQRTAHQMAVVVVQALEGKSVEDYARGLFNTWGIGRTGVDDGALLLVAVQERRVRVQVGPGVFGQLTDAKAVEIVDSITPILHNDDYAGGVVAGERAMRSALGDTQLEERADNRLPAFGGGHAVESSNSHEGTNPALVIGSIVLLGTVVLGLIFAASRDAFRRDGPGGGSGSGSSGIFAGGAAGGAAAGGGGAVGGGGGASGGF